MTIPGITTIQVGSYVKNGWVEVGGRWYLFDASGRMLTGWQERTARCIIWTQAAP